MFTIHPVVRNVFILALSWVFALVLGVDFNTNKLSAENIAKDKQFVTSSSAVPEEMRESALSSEDDEFRP